MIRRLVPISAALLPMTALSLHAQTFKPEQATREFVDAYVRGDTAAVLRLIDPSDIVVYGSDSAEFVRGGDGVVNMMQKDQELWKHNAVFGPMEKISIVSKRELVTIFFEAPFSLHHTASVPVRFALVWRREHGRWLVVQSANAVPTQHQSAAELLQSSK